MEKDLWQKIDWEAYRKELQGSLDNERIWSMGTFDKYNPHEENIEKIEEELKLIRDGQFQELIDRKSDEMGEDARTYFRDFMKEPENRQADDSLYIDALVDIAVHTGWTHLEFEDSKLRNLTLKDWAREFADRHAGTDWERNDYIELVDRFAQEKVDKWLLQHPVQPSYADRIADINVYSGRDGGMFIRCRIDGEQQSAKKLSFRDTVNFNDRTDRLGLAAVYFKQELSLDEKQDRVMKR